jgi:hypothetical protein
MYAQISMPIRSLSVLALAAAVCAGLLIPAHAAPGDLARLRQTFLSPPDDARIMMRWWWFGSAVTKPELEREMKKMKEGGIGGFEVQPVYPVELDDPEKGFVNLPYLSAGYLDALKFAADKSQELGLRISVTLGSGWPFGGPHTPITEAAGALRCDRIPVPEGATYLKAPSLSNGEKMIATFFAPGTKDRFDGSAVVKIGDGDRFTLPSGWTGPHVALFFISSRTGMQVKRPAVGAEGFVLDHYDRDAIERHLKIVGEPLMQAFGTHPPYSVFSDSLEVFASDWTPDLMKEFQKRRGYDLTPYLPALVGEMGEKTGSVRRDWGRTLTELCDERYLVPIAEWAHKHNTLFRSQTYGVPPVVLSSNALVDLPEGEHGSVWRQFTTARWASSASHLYNRPVTSSETWTWLHSPAFRATPLDMKAEADLHFLQGINQFVGHGWAYSPESAGEPGWRFYAAAVFNEHNPWWIVMPDVTKYFQRVSWLMRQGKPANDVAIYLPTDDAYSRFRAGNDSVDRSMEQLLGEHLVPQVLDAGFNFDFIDDGAIEKMGVAYPVLILPNVERIPLATLRRIDAYAAKGGIVVATKRLPSLATGLQDAADTGEIVRIAKSMKAHLVEDDAKLGGALAGLYTPDFAAGDPAIGFNHRKIDGADVYFVANTSNRPVHMKAALRIKGVPGEWWDPFSGKASAASSGGLSYDFAPYESRVLVLSAESAAKPAEPISAGTPLDVSTGWKVTFDKLGYTTEAAGKSWSDDPKTHFYSGTATYVKTVEVPASAKYSVLDFGAGTPLQPSRMANGTRAWIDPPVREAAVVSVNGKVAGSVWRAPFEVEVGGLLHAGANEIRIVVANTAINELAGQTMPDYKLLKLKYGDRFQPQDMNNLEPLPSGILGSIRLR